MNVKEIVHNNFSKTYMNLCNSFFWKSPLKKEKNPALNPLKATKSTDLPIRALVY